MSVLRTDIERALDEIASQEEGMRFQGLAVVLGKKRWPELIARPRKKDFGLDAYASASQTREKVGKGLAASITPTLTKISGDAATAKKHFPDLGMLLFATSAKVGNADRRRWEETLKKELGVELHVIEREEIITLMLMPENASLLASFLNVTTDNQPLVSELITRVKRAADAVALTWSLRTKEHPLIELTALRLEQDGADSRETLSLVHIDQALLQGRRVVLEGPAGRGKTTTLVQLARRARSVGIPFIVDLPVWVSSQREILEYIAGMPAFRAEGLTPADLARVQQSEPFLLLLNGWNEIAESSSVHASNSLRELERNFPSAGIVVATRTHYLTPPLPGALRLRLLPLQRAQRVAYLEERLGSQASALLARLEADSSLEALTRTPFLLSEVASLFIAGVSIPSRKMDILKEVLRLQEQPSEHSNALRAGPIFGKQTEYLRALATEMTRHGAVALTETTASAVVAAVERALARDGLIEVVGAPKVLATLTAHHVLERVDYPETTFRFEHQQLQEYYAAIDVGARLLSLQDDDHVSVSRFKTDYVNSPAWAEPLFMIAETFGAHTDSGGANERNIGAGRRLIEMALTVDLVFSSELAQLCGATIWNQVRSSVGERCRALYGSSDNPFRQYALAAMLATASADFSDIIVPLLSGKDQNVRLATYELSQEFHVSSLGPNWHELVRAWSDEARKDFVSELLRHRVDDEIVAFAVEDSSSAVKEAAVFSLMWIRSLDALVRVLGSIDATTFERIACRHADLMPVALRAKTVAVVRKFIDTTIDQPARLRAALDLVQLGEAGLEGVIKDAMEALPDDSMRNLGSHGVTPAVEYLRGVDPVWATKWVATKVAEGALYDHKRWLPLMTDVPEHLIEQYLRRLESENLRNGQCDGMIAIVATHADEKVASRVFAKVRDLRRQVDAEPGQRHELAWQLIRQLEAVFHHLPDDVAAAGFLASVARGDALDIKVGADLFSRVARPDLESLQIVDKELRARLREYLKGSVAHVLSQDDFNGQEKASLSSAIAQVGTSEDMADLVVLIRADIERVRRGRAARAAGDHGPKGNGGGISYAAWHIASALHLNPGAAEQVLVDLLPELEYVSEAAAAMARDFISKPERPIGRSFRYNLVWAAREGRIPQPSDNLRRKKFAAALNDEINHLRRDDGDQRAAASSKQLATALAAVDGRGSAQTILDVVSSPGRWDEYIRLEAAERLLMAGVVLPATFAIALVDSVLERVGTWMQDSERYLVLRVLALCPFVDDVSAGIAKIYDVLRERQFWGHELRELVGALGESRSDAAVGLLSYIAADVRKFQQCEDDLVSAIATLDSPRAHEMLLGFVDPDACATALTQRPDRDDVLVSRLAELARRKPDVAARLQTLSERHLPEYNRHILSRVLCSLGTIEALVANLKLIDDTCSVSIPQGVWDQLESAFVERRPYEQSSNVFTLQARTSNELRSRLFALALEDDKRRRSSLMLLGTIEGWRLQHGRPVEEPRHPNIELGHPWPPSPFSFTSRA